MSHHFLLPYTAIFLKIVVIFIVSNSSPSLYFSQAFKSFTAQHYLYQNLQLSFAETRGHLFLVLTLRDEAEFESSTHLTTFFHWLFQDITFPNFPTLWQLLYWLLFILLPSNSWNDPDLVLVLWVNDLFFLFSFLLFKPTLFALPSWVISETQPMFFHSHHWSVNEALQGIENPKVI